jgi:hypothetical protein
VSDARRPRHIEVRVSAVPDPARLRAAIAAALAGRVVTGPEGEVARRVAAVVARPEAEAQLWR